MKICCISEGIGLYLKYLQISHFSSEIKDILFNLLFLIVIRHYISGFQKLT